MAMRVIALTGSDDGSRYQVAHALISEMHRHDLNWELIRIDDIVQEVIPIVTEKIASTEFPAGTNPIATRDVRNAFCNWADDFWINGVLQKIRDGLRRDVENFIIMDIVNRGEHDSIVTSLQGDVFFIKNAYAPNTHCNYNPTAVEFSAFIAYDTHERLLAIIEQIVKNYMDDTEPFSPFVDDALSMMAEQMMEDDGEYGPPEESDYRGMYG